MMTAKHVMAYVMLFVSLGVAEVILSVYFFSKGHKMPGAVFATLGVASMCIAAVIGLIG